jgi:hypothetical protein
MSLSGARDGRDEAQLAVLDAMVFFAICLLISSVLVCNVRSTGHAQSDPLLASDEASNLLEVFLECSLCRHVQLDACGVDLSGHESIAEILSALAELRIRGSDLGPYDPILSECRSVLYGICSPGWVPGLSVCRVEEIHLAVLLSIGNESVGEGLTLAASQMLPTPSSSSVMVVLTLAPALALHAVPV